MSRQFAGGESIQHTDGRKLDCILDIEMVALTHEIVRALTDVRVA